MLNQSFSTSNSKTKETFEQTNSGANLLGPEGLMMLSIAGILDIFSALLSPTIIGSKIVYFLGLIIIGSWQLLRFGSLPQKKEGGEILAKKFFKKHWKKLVAKFIPILGDITPLWTWTVYSEFKKE